MTEKRFVYYEHKGADYILDTPNESLDFIEMLGDCLEAEEIVDLLNEQHETITKQQKIITELEKLQSKTAKQQMKFFNGLMEAEDEIEDLKKENEQLKHDATVLIQANQDYRRENEELKQRNENQYQQLNKLWRLIQAKDWENLIAMKKQLKEDEERLQREWKCYE